MPGFSAFCPFGLLRYTGAMPDAEKIYDSLLANEGNGAAFSDDAASIQQARNYARAMVLAGAKSQIDRAKNNEDPHRATELLPALERDYGIVPLDGQTFPERRAAVAARQEVVFGASQGVIVGKLTELLGADFVAYSRVSAPGKFPPDPPGTPTLGSVVAFDRPGAQIKVVRITDALSVLGSRTVNYQSLGGTSPLAIGDVLTVEPDPRGNVEAVTVTAVGVGTFTATFLHSHSAGTTAVHPCPLWISEQRTSIIRVSLAASQDAVKRQRIHDLMGRYARGVSTWYIVADTGGGPLVFTSDDATLGLPDIIPVS